MNPQLATYLRQLIKTLKNQHHFEKGELLARLIMIEQSIKQYLSYPKVGRFSFLLTECTCPTAPNLIKPNSSINPTCPIHNKA